jgi:hypothetical protein
MLNLAAQTELHEAWTNVALAETRMAQGQYKDAHEAMLDAEHHYRCARSVITLAHPSPILDKLADLKVRLDQIRSAIKIHLGTLERSLARTNKFISAGRRRQ